MLKVTTQNTGLLQRDFKVEAKTSVTMTMMYRYAWYLVKSWYLYEPNPYLMFS